MKGLVFLLAMGWSILAPAQSSRLRQQKRPSPSTTEAKTEAVYDTILYAAAFGVGSANKDNSAALSAAHSAIQALPRGLKKLLLFPDNAALHFLKPCVNLPYTANLTIDYRSQTGTVLYNDIPVPPQIFTDAKKPNQSYYRFQLIRQTKVPAFLRIPVRSDIPFNASRVQIAPAEAAQLAAGDMVSIKTNKMTPLSDRSTLSQDYKIVASADAATGWVTFTTPFYQDGGTLLVATDSLWLEARKPNENWVIKNLNLQCYRGGLGSGIQAGYLYNSVVEDCRIDGAALMQGHRRGFAPRTTDAFVGFEVKGHNLTIRNIVAENFWDYHTNLGYGLVTGGEKVVIEHSTFRRAKHGITISDGGIMAWITARHNRHDDAMFDTHPEGRYVTVEYSDFVNIGRSATAMGAWCRGFVQTIRHCRFFGADTVWASKAGSSGVSIPSLAGSIQFKIDSNEFHNLRYAIGDNNDTIVNRDFFIRGNKFFNRSCGDSSLNCGEFAVYLRNINGGLISGNLWQSRGQGLYLFRAQNLVIQNETISYGNGLYGGGIFLGPDATFTARNITVSGCTITCLNGKNAVTNPIRIDGKCDGIKVQNNSIRGWKNLSTAIALGEKTEPLSCVVIGNNAGSSVRVNQCRN